MSQPPLETWWKFHGHRLRGSWNIKGVVTSPPETIRQILLTFRKWQLFWQLTIERMTKKLLPYLKLNEEARNQNFFWHNLTGLWITDQNWKRWMFRNATFRHSNFTKFCRSINIDVQNWSRKFQIDISKIGYFIEQSVKRLWMLVCKIQNSL